MISFKDAFNQAVIELYPKGPEWDLVGIITKSSKVYTLSYDSKILSGIFEILTEPIIQKIADDNNLILKKGVQNQYPEFTLFDEEMPDHKIAVDMKSTYRQKNDLLTVDFSFRLSKPIPRMVLKQAGYFF